MPLLPVKVALLVHESAKMFTEDLHGKRWEIPGLFKE